MSNCMEITENSAEKLKKAQCLLKNLRLAFGGEDGDQEVVAMLELTSELIEPAVHDLIRGKKVVSIQAANA